VTDTGGNNRGRSRHDTFERATLGTAIAGVIVLCIYTTLTYCQAINTREAVKEATRAANEAATGNEINRRAQRAFVFINRAEMTPFKDGDAAWWAFIPAWENSGNTPPVDGHMYVNYFPSPQVLRPGFSKCQVNDSSEPPPLISVAPHGRTNVTAFNMSGATLDLFKNGNRKKFYIWGWFKYKDGIVEDRRITRFCWDIQRVIGNPSDIDSPISLPHALCNEGNCFDEDCKENVNSQLQLPDIPGCHMDILEIPPSR
jgi:hypothetical protein